jgi:hypothetical protein
MTLALRGLHPDLMPFADYCLSWADYYGVKIRVTSVLRDSERQAELRRVYEACLARGESIWPGNPNPDCRFPANRPGDSAHEYGLAWDSEPEDPRLTEWWVAVRRAVGWHVPENDLVHAELPSWRSYLK